MCEIWCTVKPVLSGHSKERQKMVFNTNFRLMQVKSIAECSKGSILQYFQPSLSGHFPLRPLFYLFLSGHIKGTATLVITMFYMKDLNNPWILIPVSSKSIEKWTVMEAAIL